MRTKSKSKPRLKFASCNPQAFSVSHIDTHKHTHMFPQVLRPLLRAARARGVPAIRNPFGCIVFPWSRVVRALWNGTVR